MAFDESNLVPVTGPKLHFFYGNREASVITATSWQTWTKPKNARMVMLFCLGGGGGGGGGLTGASGTNRGGGGGGGSGSFGRLIVPAFFLPKTLFLLVGAGGKGGLGGAPAEAGIAGGPSSINDKIDTFNNTANTILRSGNDTNGGRGGGAGSGAGGGGAGSAEIVAIAAASIYQAFGNWNATVGQGGSAAGALAAPGAGFVFGATSVLVSGGTGAGSVSITNVDQAGGAITGDGLIPTLAGGVAAAGAGQQGLHIESPFINTGGTGGGTAGAAGTAGNGGNGAIGSGGGGGGGGVTGGNGGDGGSGLIIIASW